MSRARGLSPSARRVAISRPPAAPAGLSRAEWEGVVAAAEAQFHALADQWCRLVGNQHPVSRALQSARHHAGHALARLRRGGPA